MRQRLVLLVAALAFSAACRGSLPPIQVVIDPSRPAPSKPAPTPTPTPQPPAAPENPRIDPVAPPAAPVLQNINITVLNGAAEPLIDARVTRVANTDTRRTDGGGFVNFAIPGPELFDVSAMGYLARRLDLPPGDHRVHLEAIPGAEPSKPAPPAQKPALACGAEQNTLRISLECLQAVAKSSSKEWFGCAGGSQHACHFYVRAVARALNAAQHTDRWGLITKPSGSNVEGFGEDVVAFLPSPFDVEAQTWQWRGLDIIGGAGAPGARYQAGDLHQAIPCSQWKEGMSWCNREDNFWAPVPELQQAAASVSRWIRLWASAPALSQGVAPPFRTQKRSSASPWRKRLALVFAAVCHGGDVAISQYMLAKHGDRFREANPILRGLSDHPFAFGAVKVGAASALSVWLAELSQRKPRLAFWSLVASGSAACYAGQRNSRLQ